ncbi:glycosyltransferase family 2 protein [Peptostreptococcus porci]|uniref:glycosyltransferase family 2 protein n=2 Tax=Peptostreptococcus porci TaxID=2652282 RepID=UPI0023F4F29D|nr:glycosyltransferase family 2 protein [Peptostreptococcus porci]MDD7183284.1 glycosyltransferase family 2 protein [Peptostreptococcus porci]MDY5964181.1 glycosyltransferase family 2 protein [Peptostreptococcus porci]
MFSKDNFVSVILPAYNSGKYIKSCIDSILNQSYEDFELIIVDDGSTDDTQKIINNYVDKKIKYIYQSNKGVSLARNTGIKNASGDLVTFVDADDIMGKYQLEIMVKYFCDGVDMVMCRYHKFSKMEELSDKSCDQRMEEADVSNISKIEASKLIHFGSSYAGYVWNKMYRMNKISELFFADKSNGMAFREDIAMCEDLLFNSIYIDSCDNICVLNKKLYHYYENKDGISSGKYSSKLHTQITAYRNIFDVYQKNKTEYVEVIDLLKENVLKFSIDHINRMVVGGKINSAEVKAYKEFIRENMDLQSSNNILNSKDKFLIGILMNSPFAAYKFIYNIWTKIK